MVIERYWFLTWRTYGTWLPGDERGFVGTTLNNDEERSIENARGTPQTPAHPHLRNYAQRQMNGPPIRLRPRHAADVLGQLRETAEYRGWELLTASILSTHVHLVVGVDGDPDGGDILGDFKSYASRRLNRLFGKPPNGSWWSESGSRRVVKDEGDLIEAVRYVARQEGAFLVWVNGKVKEWVIRP